MDVLSLLYLALFCVLGGFIAFYSDRWGRAIGKSRRSLFGLRPRRTAEVIIFAGGVLIPLLTILLTLAVSSDVRQWLFEGRKAIQDAKELTAERDRLTSERDQRLQEISGLDKRNKVLLTDKEKLQGQMASMQVDAAKLKKAADDARIRVASMTRDVEAKKKELDALTKDKAALDVQLKAAKKDLSSTTSSFNVLNQQFRALDTEYRSKLEEISNLNKTIDQQKKDTQELEKQLRDIRSTYDTKVQELANKQSDLDGIQQRLDDVQRDLDAKLDEYTRLSNTSNALLVNRPIYSRGDELSRLQVGANLTPQEARSEANRLLRLARMAAEDAGAKATSVLPSAGLVPFENPDRSKIPAEEVFNMFIKSITGLPDPVVLVALANFNSFKGLPVALEVKLYRNPVIFQQGDFVADKAIDGSKDVGEILMQLQDYFREQVRGNALRKGMIPIAGREDAFGSLSGNEVLDLVWRIKEVGHSIRVQALAIGDIRAGDPLKLDYRLR